MASDKPVHLFVATPCYGGLVHQRYMQCICMLLQYGSANGIQVSVELLGHESLITRGRNTLVAKFMDTPTATHMMFIDADTGFEVQQVLRMLAFDKEVVAGMYPLKLIDWNQQALERVRLGETLDHAPIRFVGAPCEPREQDGAFVAGEYAGTGFMMIKREVFPRLFEAYPQLRYTAAHNTANPSRSSNQYALFDCAIDPDTGEYLSEDYAFCQRWRKISGKIWLDTESRLVHIGSYEFFGSPKSRFAEALTASPG
ncbi:MAG: hypothetical protein WCA78_02885 [Rhizomicrobium sp.]